MFKKLEMHIKKVLLFPILCMFFLGYGQEKTNMKLIKGGYFVPLYGNDSLVTKVSDFYLDTYLVTQADYLNFVKQNDKYAKDKIIKLFADANYLQKWESNLNPGAEINLKAPVTNVSWYAAKEYCATQGKRLPTIYEWEYAAMASETAKNAQRDSLFNHKIIASYEKPKTYKKSVGSTYKNYWGVYDMHGLVWEWTSDFNAVMISGESRKDKDTDKDLFCGSASVNASNLMDYAAFMRYAFRGSIKANYCIQNLGFRCASSK